MHKITSELGDPVKRHEATRNRDKLQFARILIEVKVEQEFPDHIYFLNKIGVKISVPVTYE